MCRIAGAEAWKQDPLSMLAPHVNQELDGSEVQSTWALWEPHGLSAATVTSTQTPWQKG